MLITFITCTCKVCLVLETLFTLKQLIFSIAGSVGAWCKHDSNPKSGTGNPGYSLRFLISDFQQ